MPTPNQPTQELPDSLRPYDFHGLALNIKGKEALTECIFCGRDGKFSINVETGQWRCLVCGGGKDKGGGGILDFLESLWDLSEKSTGTNDYNDFARNRGLEYPDTLIHWRLAKSILTGCWLVPGWGLSYKGQTEFRQLYQNVEVGGRRALLPTPGRGHTFMGVNLYDPNAAEIYVCEGPWDAMRFWEVGRTSKEGSDGVIVSTGSVDSSFLQNANVLAVATCTSFPNGETKWFRGKDVTFLYDSDHPTSNEKTGVKSLPAGYQGMRRDTGKVASVAGNIFYLNWGDDGYDPSSPSGYDVRDVLKERYTGMAWLLNRIDDVPEEWRKELDHSSTEITCKDCDNWNAVRMSWRKAMKWTPGLEHALASMLACIASTSCVGDQLWLKVVGPPSCGKSTLCEAVSVNKKYVIAKSTIRGFHSGYKTTGDAARDNSLIPHIKNRTLVTKDGDTLLQSPNLGQILSEARDIYDSVSRTHYRNDKSKDYENIRMTWLLCGTSSLRQLDNSELGERFLDCVMMDKIDEELEEDILWRVANAAVSHIDQEAGTESSSHHTPERLEAMSLTGGYVTWLRENAFRIFPTIEVDDRAKRKCIALGKFVAFMRARPSLKQQEVAERELAARLVAQHIRYAKCLALVLNRPSVDSLVLKQTRQIALDTGRGVVYRLCSHLYEAQARGLEVRAMPYKVSLEEKDINKLLLFLQEIGVVKQIRTERTRVAWALTNSFRKLFKEATGRK